MKFSENWLRTFVEPSLSSGALADALTMAGIEVEAVEAVTGSDDRLFTIKPTPNRGDCLSVWGVAREVAAITGGKLTPLKVPRAPTTSTDRIEVVIEDKNACARYCGRIVRGVNARAATPSWMLQRLAGSGLRSISAVVDITNYVMLELGQPLHAFEFASIQGGIRVRFAHAGEHLRLLNEQDIALDAGYLVIADAQQPLALAGIMGGLNSAVTLESHDIFLESAFFDPVVIAGKSRLLGFTSDSAYRFERGVDFAATAQALERATQLVLEICGGQPGPVVEAAGNLPVRKPVKLRRTRAQRLLGIPLEARSIEDILHRLGFADAKVDGDECQATPPSYRFDIAIEEDLIEEIARIHGYDRIPARAPQAGTTMLPASESRRPLSALRARLTARDYQEIISYSFVERQWEEDFCENSQPVTLVNPIAAQFSVMRSSLLASLADTLRSNLSRQQDRVRLFEIGRCFSRNGDDGYEQTLRLAGMAYGYALPEQWGAAKRAVDFYDVKSDVEALLAPAIAHFEAARHPALHPGRSARVVLQGLAIGWIGELHPRLRQKYDFPYAPIAFELNLESVTSRAAMVYRAVSRQPLVRRDISVEVSENIGIQAMLDAVSPQLSDIVQTVVPFDVYRGKGIDSDKKSIAFKILLQDTDKTLTDAEVDTAVGQILRILQEQFHATLRK